MAYYKSSGNSNPREKRQPDDSRYSVKLDMEKNENAVQLKRAQSRVKQVEFELAVMKEVADVRTQQLRDSELLVDELEAELIHAKSSPLPPVLEINIGEQQQQQGIAESIQASQAMMQATQRVREEGDDVDQAEVVELRAELQKNQNRLEDLEQERNIHLAKVSELLKLLTLQSTSEAEKELYVKSLEVAELSGQIDFLQKKLEASQDRVEKLEQEREANIAMVVELSQILSPDVDDDEINEVFADLNAGRELSSKQAQLLTIQHLKHRVETLEEEKEAFLLASLRDSKETEAYSENNRKYGRGTFKFLGGGKN